MILKDSRWCRINQVVICSLWGYTIWYSRIFLCKTLGL